MKSPATTQTVSSRWMAGMLATAVVAFMVAGFFVIGAWLTSTQEAAKVGTALFFGATGCGVWAATRSQRSLRAPLGATFIVTALVLAGSVQLLTSSNSREVNDAIPAASPVANVMPAKTGDVMESKGGDAMMADTGDAMTNTVLVRGSFRDQAHAGSGTASIIKLAGDRNQVLALEKFSTEAGPDLFVQLVDSSGSHKPLSLGKLKGASGNQIYDIPASVDSADFDQVRIWCRTFSVNFTDARLA